MPRRPSFAHDTSPADLMAWIANAVSEAFTLPRVLPSMRRPPAEPAPPLPLLFEGLPDQRRGEPAPAMAAPAPEPELDDRDFPNFALMRRIVGDAIAMPSELAVTRRRLKRERAEAAHQVDAPTAQDIAEIHKAIGDILPEGVPTYAKRLLAVERRRDRVTADIVLFDDAVGRLEISRVRGWRKYSWLDPGVPGTAFHWDKVAGGGRGSRRRPDGGLLRFEETPSRSM